MVRMLAGRGADDVAGRDGRTPVQVAEEKGDAQVIMALRRDG